MIFYNPFLSSSSPPFYTHERQLLNEANKRKRQWTTPWSNSMKIFVLISLRTFLWSKFNDDGGKLGGIKEIKDRLWKLRREKVINICGNFNFREKIWGKFSSMKLFSQCKILHKTWQLTMCRSDNTIADVYWMEQLIYRVSTSMVVLFECRSLAI